MKEIGLQPTDTGAPGGKETGQSVTHYIIVDGPYARAYAKLAATGFQLQLHIKNPRPDDICIDFIALQKSSSHFAFKSPARLCGDRLVSEVSPPPCRRTWGFLVRNFWLLWLLAAGFGCWEKADANLNILPKLGCGCSLS
jgi:hypothetical protein